MLLIEEEMQVAPHDSGRHFPGDKTESSVSVLHVKHARKENIEMSINKNNKMLRRAGVLLLVLGIIFSMGSAAFAAQTDLDWSKIPNLTAYNGEFNKIVTQGKKGHIDFRIQAADNNYTPQFFPTSEYIDGLDYSWMHQGEKGYYSKDICPEMISGNPSGFVAKFGINLRPNVDVGANVLTITNPKGGTLDLGLIVNPRKPLSNAKKINIKIYNDSISPNNVLKEETIDVSYSAYKSKVNYPTAMDSVASIAKIEEQTGEGTPNAYIKTLKVGEISYKGGENYKYWMYGVYGKDGKIKPISSKIAGEAYMIEDGDTVVWMYGTWGSLPSKLR